MSFAQLKSPDIVRTSLPQHHLFGRRQIKSNPKEYGIGGCEVSSRCPALGCGPDRKHELTFPEQDVALIYVTTSGCIKLFYHLIGNEIVEESVF
jgi:hypothetical protein